MQNAPLQAIFTPLKPPVNYIACKSAEIKNFKPDQCSMAIEHCQV
jgi:hypothetical protein